MHSYGSGKYNVIKLNSFTLIKGAVKNLRFLQPLFSLFIYYNVIAQAFLFLVLDNSSQRWYSFLNKKKQSRP